ncbi:unnamed protein product [Ilex paraguariensis]|uniref:Exostosin GT47 domain-containing protein n=1 Tax=Ilex paraguariensis TaxID=185542 RepID=A0ABC8SRY9_9AQUA
MNLGLGPQVRNCDVVLQNKNWFATNQFMLEIIFHNRMKQYKCLTNDSSIASAIYVPFYAGLDVGRYLWGGFNTSVRDFDAMDLVKWLSGKPEWKRLRGRDHFFVAGRITWDFRRRMDDDESGWGNKLASLPEIRNMTMLTIESSPWSNQDFAIPYPTYFHPSSNIEVIQWQNKVREQKRKYLFSFVGASRPNLKSSIRSEIIEQCLVSEGTCKLLDCITNNCHNPVNVMKMFQSSIFCLQPPGDSYTRRSTFDSILAGCIPVFFHPGTAYIQYIWHLPKNYTKYSVFISENDIRDKKANIENILLGISEDEASAMREEVVRLIPRVIYADPRSRLESFDLEDAFDIAVKRVLERVETIRGDMEQGKSYSFDFPEQFSWKYYWSGTMEDHKWDAYFTKTSDANSSRA